MKVLILGSGFGLYGYLPALSKFKNVNIILPDRYKERLSQRPDIASFYNRIEWFDNRTNMLELCEGLIIALPPVQQLLWVKKALQYKNISHLLLEKPLAPTPDLAMNLISDLEISKKKFKIGYNFRYTYWGKDILRHIMGIKRIIWKFEAYHYKKNIQTWKRLHKEGGGALRFYGIHLIALLSELGYCDVSYSKIEGKEYEAEIWNAKLLKVDLPPCIVTVATNSKENIFQVIDINGHIITLSDPFQAATPCEFTFLDHRIPYLVKLLKDLFFEEKFDDDWYKVTNFLWNQIEQRTLS